MSVALTLLKRAIQLLTHDPLRVAKILLPAFLGWLAILSAPSLFPKPVNDQLTVPELAEFFPGDSVLIAAFVAFLVIGFVLMPWSAIAFHRYVLRDQDGPGAPPWGTLVPYILRSLLLGVMIGLPVAIAAMILMGFLMGSLAALVTASILLGVLVSWLFLRFGLILPAISVGEKLSLAESRAATKPLSGALWGVSLILAGVSLLLSLRPLPGVVVAVVDAVWWVLQIAILTTLYGHLIEHRPLETS